MLDLFTTLHFLHPVYFFLLVPTGILVAGLMYRRQRRLLKPTKAIAPHLLAELVDKPNRRQGYGPILAIALLLCLMITVLAKPVWQMSNSSPKDNAPLYIVMDESLSMNKRDVAPNRNLKAQLIVKQLIQSGVNRPIALVALAGSSHILLPPSDDQELLSLYLSYLDPKVMPKDGGDLMSLVSRLSATHGLKLDGASLLLVTDGVSSGTEEFSALLDKHHIKTAVLYFNGLGKQISSQLNIPGFDGTSMSISDPALQQYFLNTQDSGVDSSQWQDESHALIIIATLLVALWFRKGWTLQWTLSLLLLMPYSQPSQAGVLDWFMTQDQQGMALMYMGKFQEAEQHFEDPNWKGVACYYQEDFKCAQKQFSKVGDAQAIFNMANAAAQDGRYKTAQQLYTALLDLEPNHIKAQQNLKKIDDILLEMRMLSENQHDSHPPSKDAVPPPKDANEIADGANRKSYGQIPHSKLKASEVLSSKAATDKWLRDISLDPKDFVRRKFLSEYNQGVSQ